MKITPIDSEFLLDSFKIRIPFSDCKIINPSITSKIISFYEDTGEVIPSAYKKKGYKISDGGASLYFGIEKQTTAGQRIKEFVYILLNSKILKEYYFDGISKKHKKRIFQALMSYKVISFSYKSFLNAELTDVDFKKDIQTNEINRIINGCLHLTKDSHRIPEICDPHTQKKNKGIQWSKRETTQINTKPFFKIYHKSIELKYHSTEFYEAYIKDNDNDFDNRVRIEYTIKNKKHFRLYGINSTKLKDILNLSKESKNKMFTGTLEKHLDIYEDKPIRIRENLSPNNKIILKLMDIAIKTEKYVPDRLLDLLVEDIRDRKVRSRKKKELKVLFEERLKLSNKSAIKQAQIRQEIIDMLLS